MQLRSTRMTDGESIPRDYAMGVPGEQGPEPGPNRSPPLEWSDVPAATQSFALLCIDVDAPSDSTAANRTDQTIARSAPRADFYHWILIDIAPVTRSLPEGADSDGVTPKGKPPGQTPHGVRGINSYKEWFGDDPQMGGDYGGYDGPWPPFNDERIHRYTFTLYALDVAQLPVSSPLRGPAVLDAMQGHILAEARLTVSYSLNPAAS